MADKCSRPLTVRLGRTTVTRGLKGSSSTKVAEVDICI